MSKPDAFATIRRARSLRERHADASPSVVLVALTLATYANGSSGTSIRPGYALVAEQTGLNVWTVRRAIRWLESRGELRRDKEGHRGSAACFTFLCIGYEKGCAESTPIDRKGCAESPNGVRSQHPHQPNQPTPSGPDGPPGGGKRCRQHPTVEIYQGACWACEQEAYWAKHGGAPS